MIDLMQAGPNFADRWWMRYFMRPFAIAVFFVYVTSLLTLVLQAFFPYPFLFLYFGAVIGSAWFGGAICEVWPGLGAGSDVVGAAPPEIGAGWAGEGRSDTGPRR